MEDDAGDCAVSGDPFGINFGGCGQRPTDRARLVETDGTDHAVPVTPSPIIFFPNASRHHTPHKTRVWVLGSYIIIQLIGKKGGRTTTQQECTEAKLRGSGTRQWRMIEQMATISVHFPLPAA